MNRTYRRILALLTIAVLALAFTLLAASGDRAAVRAGSARALFQVSPLESPEVTPTDTVEPLNAGFPTLEPPTAVPLLPTVGPTATPKGFLPAPTIVNPNDLQSLPLAQPAVSGGGAPIEPTATPAAAPRDPLLRATVALLNYVWLLCGGILLIGGATAIFLLWRRDQRS